MLKIIGKQLIAGISFTGIEGGFGEGKKAILVKDIAEIHNQQLGEINRRINDNRIRFIDGVDIIDLLNGFEPFREFAIRNGLIGSNRTKNVFILSERGYAKLLKILEDDKAWDLYDKLVDKYFHMREHTNQDPVELALETSLKNYQEIKAIKGDVDYLKENMRIDGSQEFALTAQGKAKVLEVLGGYESPAYNAVSKKAFAELWRDFKGHFRLPRYSELPKTKFDDAVYFISKWRPSTSLEIVIENHNQQRKLNF